MRTFIIMLAFLTGCKDSEPNVVTRTITTTETVTNTVTNTVEVPVETTETTTTTTTTTTNPNCEFEYFQDQLPVTVNTAPVINFTLTSVQSLIGNRVTLVFDLSSSFNCGDLEVRSIVVTINDYDPAAVWMDGIPADTPAALNNYPGFTTLQEDSNSFHAIYNDDYGQPSWGWMSYTFRNLSIDVLADEVSRYSIVFDFPVYMTEPTTPRVLAITASVIWFDPISGIEPTSSESDIITLGIYEL